MGWIFRQQPSGLIPVQPFKGSLADPDFPGSVEIHRNLTINHGWTVSAKARRLLKSWWRDEVQFCRQTSSWYNSPQAKKSFLQLKLSFLLSLTFPGVGLKKLSSNFLTNLVSRSRAILIDEPFVLLCSQLDWATVTLPWEYGAPAKTRISMKPYKAQELIRGTSCRYWQSLLGTNQL